MSQLTDDDQTATTPEAGWWRKLLGPGRFAVLVVILVLAAAAAYLGVRAFTLSSTTVTPMIIITLEQTCTTPQPMK